MKRATIGLAMAAALSVASAEQPELLKSGQLMWNGSARDLAGVRPAGENWFDRWQEALDYREWSVASTPAGLQLSSGKLKMANLLIAMEAAAPVDGKASSSPQSTEARSSLEAVTALSLDGNLYAPALMEYLLADDLVVFETGRSLYCVSGGNSAGHPTPEITAIIDSRIVPLDGRTGVFPIEYDLKTDILHIRSSHGDMACGPADAVRITLEAPAAAIAGNPTTWAVRATNHTDRTIENLDVVIGWDSPITGLSVSSNCVVSGETVDCVRGILAPGETWEELIGVSAPEGALVGSCDGAMTSDGRVASENCRAELEVAPSYAWIEVSRLGPTQVLPAAPFVWDFTLTNTGNEMAQSIQLVNIASPGDDLQFLQALEGASCTSSQSAAETTVTCELVLDLLPGEEETVRIEMRADQAGTYEMQCSAHWQADQSNQPEACSTILAVEVIDEIFESRFESNN